MSQTFTAGKLRFVRYATRYPCSMWYFALDLGQRRNLSDSLTIKPVFITGGKGAYDDLAIATGLAAWAATNGFPELLLEVEGKSRNIRHSIDGEGPLF